MLPNELTQSDRLARDTGGHVDSVASYCAHQGGLDPKRVRFRRRERPGNAEREPATSSDVSCSRQAQWVDAMEHYGNRRPRVERLVSAWNQGIRENAESEDGADDPLIGASAEPKKRPRTRLTDEEVDAMRTARAQGVSVNALARRFGVHRGTVWAKTR